MYVRRNIAATLMLRFAWRPLLFYALLNLVAVLVYDRLGLTGVAIPFLPVATIGTAVAFYVGFKNNSSYERLWEARRIWGSIATASRAWAMLVCDVLGAKRGDVDSEEVAGLRRELVHRQIAWAHCLRLQLRERGAWPCERNLRRNQVDVARRARGHEATDAQLESVLIRLVPSEEAHRLCHRGNRALHLLRNQSRRLTEFKYSGLLDDFEHSDLEKLVLEGLAQQGAAERIKSFPFPRQYAYFSGLFVIIFLVLLPFSLLAEMSHLPGSPTWLTIPFCLLISWVFTTMEQVGDSSEDPFENGINDVPMTAICTEIEIELRSLLGDQELPERVRPVEYILL
jgi:putative membrane protein